MMPPYGTEHTCRHGEPPSDCQTCPGETPFEAGRLVNAALKAIVDRDTEIHHGHLRFADRFVTTYGGQYLHAHGIGWHQWDNTRWAPCLDGAPVRALRALLDTAYTELPFLEKSDAKALFGDIQRCSSAAGVKGTLELAGNLHPCAVAAALLDNQPLLFNTASGTVNLDTGDAQPPSPTDHITKVAGAAFDPGAQSPDWEMFLARVLPDAEVRQFVQRLLGYAMLGVVREHVLPIWVGEGANGKGVLRDAVMAAFGDYAHEVDPEILMETKHPRHGTFKMQLRGRRLVFCSETEKGRRFSDATMKRLTGGDPIEANLMRRDPITFDPSHTLVMITNHLPEVSGDDPAVWRRVLVVPFDVVIPPSERDERLPERLRSPAARAAVLAWVHAGYLAYQEIGLDPPEAVRLRTDRYQMESDAVGRFLDEEVVFGAAQMVAVKALYERYEMWCRENDERPLTKTMLGKELGRRQYASEKGTAGTRWYRGMGLRPIFDDDDEKTCHIDIAPEQGKDSPSGASGAFPRSPYTRAHREVSGKPATRATDAADGGFDEEAWPPGWDEEVA